MTIYKIYKQAYVEFKRYVANSKKKKKKKKKKRYVASQINRSYFVIILNIYNNK
jgi:hypothetical protein